MTIFSLLSCPSPLSPDLCAELRLRIVAGRVYEHPTSETVNALRKLIISGDPVFEKAKAAYASQKVFVMGGTEYKRDRYPDQPAENRIWLNRKDIFFFTASSDFDDLYSPDLPKMIAKDFKKIAPIYDFFIKAEQIKDNL